MTTEISGGWLDGRMIRRARKAHRCANHRHSKCANIKPGDLYAEGDMDPDYAGGFGLERYCLPCAGTEAQEAATRVIAEPRAIRPQSLARERYESAWREKTGLR